ncbi:2-dehydro-3-deoxy-6-phosphogalactonate aldolase [Vibrio sp. CK2-1]|uniref:2-dehydro-3-deoxy-6-phosphogalactonate aldolase n=1 Tax=Vibrio sp. CK2-1 TaxID=2912249 RepID=UPI001F1AD309|nr:2-dehydro-3-deoxy-6-phosphogalactonate aldolase [Vibrio sp. CK2-1]MCF7352982.1 2-dehydro-3-deoxy-6-phosphogalactonate aldolase [Vibrio sp. CK2-1]
MRNQSFNLCEHLPLIAIIRGIKPNDAVRITQILIDEGFTMIEVPLNSPDALKSIKLLVNEFGEDYLIGAGTVTTASLAKDVIQVGASLVVTPNVNEEVIKICVEAGCVTLPGVMTPTEAFSALAAGATGLKLFPVSVIGLNGFKALKSVIPNETACFPVGGINPTVESMKPYLELGASGFGLGASLYHPELTDEEVRMNARSFIDNYKLSLS